MAFELLRSRDRQIVIILKAKYTMRVLEFAFEPFLHKAHNANFACAL